MNRVNVYRYWISDVSKTGQVLAPHAATAAAISRIQGARAIPVTVEEVEEHRLDPAGFLIAL